MPIPGQRATERRDQVQNSHNAEAVAAAKPFAGVARQHRAYDRPPDSAGHCDAQPLWSKMVYLGQSRRSAGDYGCIEAKKQPAKSSNDCAASQVRVQLHAVSPNSLSARTSSRVHIGIAPVRLATKAPTRLAKSATCEGFHPCHKPCRKAAAKASPAPTVSATCTEYPFACTNSSPIKATQPWAPVVTQTAFHPNVRA